MSGPRVPRASATPVAQLVDDRWRQMQVIREAEHTGPNAGTLDARLFTHCGCDEFGHYRQGYVDGHRHGLLQALLCGFLLGASAIGIALQFGLAIGGAQ